MPQLALLVDDVVVKVFSLERDSKNGIRINYKQVKQLVLKPNDVLQIGWNAFKLLDERSSLSETTVLTVLD